MSNYQCEALDDYLDGLLDSQARDSYELHLETCNECAAAVELQGELDQALRTYSKGINSPSAQPNATRTIERDYAFERQAVFAFVATVAAAICAVVWLPNFGSSKTATTNKRGVQVSASSDVTESVKDPAQIGNAEQIQESAETREDVPSEPSSSSLRSEWIQPGQGSHLEMASAIEISPIVRTIECEGHVTVHSPAKNDELTFVMLYPKVSFQKKEDANAN